MGKLSYSLEQFWREVFLSLDQFTRVLEIPLNHCIGRTICESYRSQRRVTGGVLRESRGTQKEQVRDPPMLQVHTYHRIGLVCTYNRTALNMGTLVPGGFIPPQARKRANFHSL